MPLATSRRVPVRLLLAATSLLLSACTAVGPDFVPPGVPWLEDWSSTSLISVLQGAVMRTALFIAVSFYAWGTIWLLEHWRAERVTEILPLSGENTT